MALGPSGRESRGDGEGQPGGPAPGRRPPRSCYPPPPSGCPGTLEVDGRVFILLIGAGLHRSGPDLASNARFFADMLEPI